ncbi:hypothetical protein VPH13_13230 [Stenotrophomonas pavanii]|uniref:hypothetical protein n=1 Tax=Stenotrophomonas pavanii TaxID=487698 RepID=UPI002DB76D75|nr:hypothetical protein [Stenotrophomonas pavanii]MEC4339680.1 hypothetical protein [Stenotrophomonas pavanii]
MSTSTPSLGRFRPTSPDDFSVRAKHAAWLLGTPLQATQEWLARLYGYGGLHELQQDLKLRLKDPETYLPGPYDEDFERQMFAAITDRSRPINPADHMMPTHRGNALLAAVAAFKGIPYPGGRLSSSDWKIREIGLFSRPEQHREAFQAIKLRIDILSGDTSGSGSPVGSDYAYLDSDKRGAALLSFTAHGRAVLDALHDVTQEADHQQLQEYLPLLDDLVARYPQNPWVRAIYVITLSAPYWQRMWADDLPHGDGFRGFGADSADNGYKTHAKAFALELLPHAKAAIKLFEDLYGGQSKNIAHHKLIGAGGKYGADTFYYPAILYFGGMVALNAGDHALAKRWLSHNLKVVPEDNFGSRYPLSAVNLALGRGPTSGLFKYKKAESYTDPWYEFVRLAEFLRDGKTESAKDVFVRILEASPHALRAIDGSYHDTDDCWVGSNHNHIVHFQEFFHRSKLFWERDPGMMKTLKEWGASKELREAYKALHLANSATVGNAFMPRGESVRVEEAKNAAQIRFKNMARTVLNAS